ncbi:universal stress protein [Pseudodonghicola flavimaris]|uniref:Universal stress protein n=1 Tax=Pseudodonghicola flavimaris TaxID=3050036 RepID=A0ABT7F1Q3_9RHOB|nr:universal stress protein [Pseudodonghicola flavimaris]MDK3018526.1 universal stress protein [Pseudodonghicola flavimaris]
MFSKIMIPVDLAHLPSLRRALDVAADLAAHYGATLIYAAVTADTPGALGHTPAEFAKRLESFAASEADAHGIATEALALTSNDPRIDLDRTLIRAADEISADLVVMASHIPNLTDYIWPSNGGTIAAHAKISVMIVRG